MSGHSKRSSKARLHGTTVVEASLVLTLLLAMLFTIFDFGYILFMRQSLLHAAQSAARYGIVRPFDAAKIQSMVLYGRPDGSGPGLFGLTPENVEVSRESGTAADPHKDRIVIRIKNYTYPAITWYVAGHHVGRTITVSLTIEEN